MKTACSLALALLCAACGSSDEPGGGAEGAADAATDSCTFQGLTASSETAERDDELGLLFYTATAGTAPNIDRMTVDFYFDLGATDGPHSYDIDGQDLVDCHTCLLLFHGCSDTSCASAQVFLAESGTLQIDAMGAAGTQLTGRLQDALFQEVTIDFSTQETTPVPDGGTWCVGDHEFDVAITAP